MRLYLLSFLSFLGVLDLWLLAPWLVAVIGGRCLAIACRQMVCYDGLDDDYGARGAVRKKAESYEIKKNQVKER